MLLITLAIWLDRREREMLAYLIEENRVLRRQLGGQRVLFQLSTDLTIRPVGRANLISGSAARPTWYARAASQRRSSSVRRSRRRPS
jgi:hypothetical protein